MEFELLSDFSFRAGTHYTTNVATPSLELSDLFSLFKEKVSLRLSKKKWTVKGLGAYMQNGINWLRIWKLKIGNKNFIVISYLWIRWGKKLSLYPILPLWVKFSIFKNIYTRVRACVRWILLFATNISRLIWKIFNSY